MIHKLKPDELRVSIDLAHMDFDTTESLEAESGFLGQPRAKAALDFGISMKSSGYNLYVMGESGTGRQNLVSRHLKDLAQKEKAPNDWLCLNNFDEPHQPHVISMPPGKAKSLKQDFEEFVNELLDTFPSVFESPAYQLKRSLIEQSFNRKYDEALIEVDRVANRSQVAMIQDSNSVIFSPMIEGKALDDTEFAQLPEEVRVAFQTVISQLESLLNEQLAELPTWRRESNEELRQLNNETVNGAIKPIVRDLEHKYQGDLQVLRYVRQIKTHLPKLILDLFAEDTIAEGKPETERKQQLQGILMPNILVQQDDAQGAPVVYEMSPSYQNLFGRVEYSLQQGNPTTSFQNVRAGALHKANGGYLIVEAEKLLVEPNSWEALKLALATRQIKLDSQNSEASIYSPVTISPQSVPLDIKIIVIGSRNIYYQLLDLDPEFHELFRVLVDFDNFIPSTEDNVEHLVRRVKHYADSHGYLAITKAGVCRLLEHSLRQSEHQARLSARIINIFKVVAEANMRASQLGANCIDASHIQWALSSSEFRNGRIAEQMLLEIQEGTILIDTDGYRIGRVNGLTVMEIGESQFGSPARITATAHPGSKGIVDIERESELGQAIHSKGVLILNGFMGHTYGRDFPLMLSAHIAMEQSYGHVDGDSATMAETCALLSAIADVPVKQGIAMTGSMNQHGDIQAVGGVNEKIEGFFKLCKSRGLTGDQGVIIPKDNVRHLMLDHEVVDAVREGRFNIWSVSQINETLDLIITGDIGKADENYQFPQGSFNHKVYQRLKEFADMEQELDQSEEE